MKNIKIIFGILIFFLAFTVKAQKNQKVAAQFSASSFAGGGWLNQGNLCRSSAFIENKGQFDDIAGAKNKGILYQLEESNMQVSFTSKGLIYIVYKSEKASEREWEEYIEKNQAGLSKEEEREKMEGKKEHYIPKIAIIEMNWNGANSDIEVVSEDPTSNYFNYYRADIDKDKVIGNVKGFRKIIYKNVYPFIDVEYSIHPKEGIKYSYILHPGANPSLISMGYSGANIKLDHNNNLQFITDAGNITDHAPLTYRGDLAKGNIIDSKFKLIDKNTIGFQLANGITAVSETIVIDPWQVGPSFPVNGYTPNDLSVDGAGNVLVYSYKPPPFLGTSTQRIDKYTSAGALIWTFNLSTNAGYTGYQGDVVADPAGNIYACIGLGPNNNTGFYNTIKINSAGTGLIWGNSSAGTGSNNMMESWTITFNCNYTQFYQSGGGRIIGGTTYFNISVEEPVNAATGVEGTLIQNDTLGDIYCTYYSPDGFVYHMTTDSNVTPDLAGASMAATTGTHNNLVCFNPGTGARLFRVQLGNSYSYIDGDVKAPGSVGMNAMVSSCQYLYTMSGNKLDRWNPLTGAHYNQISIPGGVGGTANAGVINSGILTDKCGNVYVGSNGNIYVYSPTLGLINTIGGFPGVIFDLAWANSANTDIVACGGTSNATTFLKDVAVTACVLPNTVTITPTQPTCTTVASATATASFCGAPYSYSWSNGQTTQIATNLAPGTHTVTVSSSISCPYSYVETQTVTINPAPGSPTVTVTSTSVCAGSAGTITASGATTYSWSTGATTNTISASPASTTSYTVTGTTASCTASAVGTITVVPNPTITVTSASVCASSAGTITASGATTYLWNTGATTNTISASPASTTSYTVTGTTATCTASAVGAITVVPNPTVSVNSPTICANTSTTLTATGATTYSWTPATGLSATTGANVTASPTVTTSYTVTGTSSTCTSTAVALVTVNPTPTVTVNSATICPTTSTTLTANGASTYIWTPSATLSSSTGTSVTASPGATTTYTITGTALGCTATATSTVTIGGSITPTVNSPTICAGSTATLTAGGAATYSWSPGTNLSATTGASVTANPGVTTTYTITGVNGGCSGTVTSIVTVDPLPTVTVNSPSICVGGSTTLTANGATTYSWTPATDLSASTGTSVTATPTVTTTYTVVGTSATCTAQATSIVTVNPLPPVSVNSATVCPGATATLTATGAATYTWSPSATLSSSTGATVTATPSVTTNYTITGTSAAGCTATSTSTVTIGGAVTPTVNSATICSGTSATLTASGAATYTWSPATGLSGTSGTSVTANPTVTTTYTVTGVSGSCTGTVTSLVTVNPLPAITVNSATICMGQQTATLTAGGASTFTWTPSATLSSPNGSPVTAFPIVTTTYTVSGTDMNGCVNMNTTAVTVNPLPTITVNSATICPTFSGTLNAGGALTYSWNTGATTASITDSPAATTSYTVTGTDNNGCFSNNTATITVNATLLITAGNNSPICEGTTLNLTASTGSSWSWTGPLGYTSTTQNPNIPGATPGMSGTYSVTATDANGCQGSSVTTVTVNPLPVITVGSNSPICVNQTLSLTATGGPGYNWSGPNNFTSTSQNPAIAGITAAASGTYSLTVTDGTTNCANTSTLSVVINPLPVITATGTNVCVGATINLSSNGGTVYSWSGPNAFNSNSQNPTLVNADATMTGNYIVTASDINGCVNAAIAIVTVNNPPNVTVNSGTICAGSSMPLNALGANTYNWSPSTGLSSVTGASVIANPNTSASYSVIGTDLNGCSNTAITSVTVIPVLALNITPPITTGCAPVCVSFTNTTAATGICSWIFGDGTTSTNCAPGHCFTGQGTFFSVFTVTDANGCTNSDTAKIVVYPMPHPDFSFDPQPATILDPIINFHNLSSGAVITALGWTFGDASLMTSTAANPIHTYPEAGTYPVQLVTTTNFGCKDSVTKYIVIGEEFMIYVPNAFSPNSDGTNDLFFAKGEGIKSFKMYIFDRWGEQVFFSDDIFKGWDGRFKSKGTEIVQEDVYVWKIELKSVTGQSKTLTGTVSLVK